MFDQVVAEHEARMARHAAEVDRLEGRSRTISLLRLVFFLAMVVVGSAGFSQGSWALVLVGVGLAAVFGILVAVHARSASARHEAEARQGVHARHLLRVSGRSTELPPAGAAPVDHAYATDIDLVGEDSLQQRIDVSRTVSGEITLSRWLLSAAAPDEVRRRQEAVSELARDLDFRESLEAFGARAYGDEKLDAAPFLKFTERPPLVRGPLVPLIFVLPLAFIGLATASALGYVPRAAWMVALAVQAALAFSMGARVIDVFQLVAARRGYVESLQRMLVLIEQQSFESEKLQDLAQRVRVGGRPPSAYMARLDRWAGLAEFYTQFPLHFFVNLAVLWDLHVLLRLEKWNRDVGQGLAGAFTALGEIEALASLATLQAGDPSAVFPELPEEAMPFEAIGLAHPILAADTRVPNDVTLPLARGSALIVTGSNMAGKSTLLRSVGLNIALAFAGGPVIAERMRISPLRLRASMRIDDSLQRGASYFHAELGKLRSVVEDAEDSPPIFFLLDELLRGTNARARHLGARAVLRHLLDRDANGITATHDIALSRLEEEHPQSVRNVHFTDVMEDGEMLFDYRLRDGVVKTSNALRLLQMAGVEVDVDDQLPASVG